MEFNNNIVDIISLAIIAISILLGFSRGLIRECYTILAWVLSFFSTIQFGPIILPFTLSIPFLEEFFLGNCPLAMLVSYIVTFVLSLTFFSILIILVNISKTNESNPILRSADRFGGIFFGFVRSILVLLLLLIFTQDFLPEFSQKNEITESIDKSLTTNFLNPSKDYLSVLIYENGEIWLKNTYDFVLNNECKNNLKNAKLF